MQEDDRFADWPAIAAYLRENYAAQGDSAALTVLISVNDRSISVSLAPHDALGRPWFEMTSKLGTAHRVPPGTVMSRSLGVIVSSPYHEGANLWVRQLLPIGVRRVDLDDALLAFARVADDGAESNRIRDDKGIRGRATPWTDWPSEEQ